MHVLSNLHHPKDAEVVSRKLFNESYINVTCPKATADYNSWMNAVDKSDQKRTCYRTDAPRSFGAELSFLNAAIVNSSFQTLTFGTCTFFWLPLDEWAGGTRAPTARKRWREEKTPRKLLV